MQAFLSNSSPWAQIQPAQRTNMKRSWLGHSIFWRSDKKPKLPNMSDPEHGLQEHKLGTVRTSGTRVFSSCAGAPLHCCQCCNSSLCCGGRRCCCLGCCGCCRSCGLGQVRCCVLSFRLCGSCGNSLFLSALARAAASCKNAEKPLGYRKCSRRRECNVNTTFRR